jgi:HlyD family secretion protein
MMRHLVKQLVTIILALLVIGAIVFGGIKLWQKATYEENEDVEQAVPVQVIEIEMPYVSDLPQAEPEDTSSSISKTAFVVADQEVDVFAEVSGVIKELNIREGQEVKAGELVATLGDSTQLKTAASSYNAAIASLKNAEKQIQLAKLSTGISVSTFNNQIISAENSIRQASFQLVSGQDIRGGQRYLEDLQKRNTKLQEKLNTDSITASTADQDNLRSAASTEEDKYQEYVQAKINSNTKRIDTVQQDISDIQGLQQDSQYESQIRESKNQIDTILKQMESTRIQGASQVTQLHSQIIQLRQQLESAQINLAAGSIKSPVSGIITRMDVRTGNRVGPSAPIFTVTNLQSTLFQISLTPSELIMLRDKAVSIELFGEEIPAEIVYIGAVADTQTKTIQVKIVPTLEVKVPLIPNTFAKIKFTDKPNSQKDKNEEPKVDYPYVPVRVMKFDGGKYLIPVAVDGLLTYKEVSLGGKIQNGLAPIKSGLSTGDLVIIERLNLDEGSLVQPI